MVMRSYYDNKIENEYSKITDIKYRRSLGQFFTPFQIAEFMSEWILGNEKDKLHILDPAAGFGIFERAIKYKNNNLNKKLEFELWEIDKNILNKLSNIISNLELKAKIFTEDFLFSSWEKKYDGIIANPPYYKHHYIKNKNKIFEKMCIKSNFRFSIQTNIYCWFLIKSMNLLDIKGRLAFIVPSEFLNANYGLKVKEYLRQSGIIVHLINIHFKKNVFDRALTTSIIILGEKTRDKYRKINFYNVEDIKYLCKLENFLHNYPKKTISIYNLDPKIKWRNYFYEFKYDKDDKNLISFSAIGHFSRGIATGANKFFTLSEEEKERYKIPETNLIPCITKAHHVKDIHFTEKDFDLLRKSNKKIYLFDGKRCNSESCKKYIEMGEKSGLHKRYLTKNRIPWYALEKREVSQIWVSVFGRVGLKFIWNETKCLNLTCFHAFYPKEKGKKYIDILFIYLNTDFARKLFEREKREYGNGLEKFEPNDINKSLIFNFDLLKENQIKKLRELQKKFLLSTKKKRSEILEKANEIFKKAYQSG